MAGTPAIEFVNHVLHDPVMFFHLLGVPLAVRGLHITVRSHLMA
jgi:hypothetical protein